MRVVVKPSFIGYLLVLLILSSSYENCIGMIIALFVHEAAHYLVAMAIHEPIERVEIAPFGGVMIYRAGYSPSKGLKGLMLAAAGPAGNYLIIWLLAALAPMQVGSVVRSIMMANLSMLIINLIPALPLDGGAALFSVGYYLFNVAHLIRVLSMIGMLTGAGLCAAGVMGLVRFGILNLSFLIVGMYLMLCAYQCAQRMLAQNLYSVIQEHMENGKKERTASVRLYRLTGNERLCDLVTCIAHDQAPVFMLEDEAGGVRFFSSTTLCKALLQAPYESVSAIIEKHPG